jgi:parallel beta-helix repeat protein
MAAVGLALVPTQGKYGGEVPMGTIVPVTISGNVTWDTYGSPYLVGHDVEILPNASLTVLPGVEVRFEGVWNLSNSGNLRVSGVAGKEVRFIQNKTGAAIQYSLNVSAGHLVLLHTTIENGRVTVTAPATFRADGADIRCDRPTCGRAVLLQYVVSPTMRNLTIVQRPTKDSSDAVGVAGYETPGLVLDSFVVDGGTPESVQLGSGCNRCIVSNGTIVRLTTTGVYLQGNDSEILNVDVDATGLTSTTALSISGDRNAIRGNHIRGSEAAIAAWGSGYNIEGNSIERPIYDGISISGSTGSTVRGNRISGAGRAGILLFTPPSSPGNSFLANLINGSATAVLSEQSQAIFTGNIFRGNGMGMSLSGGSNQVYHNRFEFNTNQARDTGAGNAWDNGYPSGGNWWSDYAAADLYSGSNQNIPGSDGIGDAPRPVGPNGVDQYPFYTVLAPSAPRQVTARTSGLDILLTWVEGPGPRADRFLVYRAASPVGFDFSAPVANVSAPNWTDAGAGAVDGPSYYTVRALNLTMPAFSTTGNSAGEWTYTFPAGVKTFSLPLAPYPWIDYTQPGWVDTIGEFSSYTGATVEAMEAGRWQPALPTSSLELGRGYLAVSSGTGRFTFTGLPAAMIEQCGYPPCPYAGFDPVGGARLLSGSLVGDSISLRWPAPAGFGLGDRYEVRAARSPTGVLGDPGVDYAAFTVAASGSSQDSFVVPLKYGAWRGSSTYSVGVWTETLPSGYQAIGLPLVPWKAGLPIAMNVSDLITSGIVGIEWFSSSRQDWVAHAAWMPAGTYDANFEMIMAVQVDASAPTRIVFVGV